MTGYRKLDTGIANWEVMACGKNYTVLWQFNKDSTDLTATPTSKGEFTLQIKDDCTASDGSGKAAGAYAMSLGVASVLAIANYGLF